MIVISKEKSPFNNLQLDGTSCMGAKGMHPSLVDSLKLFGIVQCKLDMMELRTTQQSMHMNDSIATT